MHMQLFEEASIAQLGCPMLIVIEWQQISISADVSQNRH